MQTSLWIKNNHFLKPLASNTMPLPTNSEKIVMKEDHLPLSIIISFRSRSIDETQGLLFQFFLKELFLAVEKSSKTMIQEEDTMNVSLFFALELFFFQLLGTPSSLGLKGDTGSLQKSALYLKYLTSLDHYNLTAPFNNLLELACNCYLQYMKIREKNSLSKKQFLLSKPLKKNITTLQNDLQNFANLIEPLLTHFKNQESVLFFLLKQFDHYDRSLKKPFFAKALRQLFCEGFSSINVFLLDRYSNKGFYHLLPLIEQKAKELEKESFHV